MKKRICFITIALCTVLCIVFTTGCSKTAKSNTILPEVRNNGTAIQWKYSDEADWHDLVALTELQGAAGENGKNGTDGKDGVDGKNGADGKDGIGIAKAEINADGELVLTYTDGKAVNLGKVVGANGKDGLTPFIGENGNWWIGEKDTGVKAAADAAVPAGSGNISASSPALIVIGSVAGLALLGNLGLILYIVLKKKKSLV